MLRLVRCRKCLEAFIAPLAALEPPVPVFPVIPASLFAEPLPVVLGVSSWSSLLPALGAVSFDAPVPPSPESFYDNFRNRFVGGVTWSITASSVPFLGFLSGLIKSRTELLD
jgi:hypothetical protein